MKRSSPRKVLDFKRTSKGYPGQCVHVWAPKPPREGTPEGANVGEVCTRCPATCRRDATGRIDVYSANLPFEDFPPRRASAKAGARR